MQEDPAVQALLANDAYDAELCTTAQRMLLRAEANDYETITLYAEDTFVVEQMNENREDNTVTVASLTSSVKAGSATVPVTIACKMINQDRGRFILQLKLEAPRATCRDVNELTYAIALEQIGEENRTRYLKSGTPLKFVADYPAAAGGEWLPSVISDFITPVRDDAGELAYVNVQAPSVQVPWPTNGGDWYEGTHHCKLITLTAMKTWMTEGALTGATELFPRPKPKCLEPDSRTSTVGSCLLYFGPAGAQLCQDYSGSGWSETTAREDCAIRHATKEIWDSASKEYSGGGGIFSSQSCIDRGADTEATRTPVNMADSEYRGTCVFRCNTPDEALWHQLTPMAGDPDGRMLERTCDLFLRVDW